MNLQKKILLALGILHIASFAHATNSFKDKVDQNLQSETLRNAQLVRKIAICGPESLIKDSTSNYSPESSGWFEGYSKVLVDPHEAFLAKVLMIQKAQKSIDISTYIFSADESSNAYLEQLRLAVRRGVNVRFSIDSSGSMGEALKDQYRHLQALLEAQNEDTKHFKPGTVDMVVFHPMLHLRAILSHFENRFLTKEALSSETTLNWDRRSHDKIIIIDKEIPGETMAIVGGRNFDNSYYGIPKVDDNTYEDMEILMKDVPRSLTGRNLSNTLEQHYQDLFCSKGNRWLSREQFGSDFFSKKALKDFDGALDLVIKKSDMSELYAKMKTENFLDTDLQPGKLHSGNEIENLKRHSGKVMANPDLETAEDLPNGDSIYTQIYDLIYKADSTIDVCTPYIFIKSNERDCLKNWVMSKPGRQIRVLSNSAATSDSALAMATFDKETAPDFMKSGPYTCHQRKIVDGKIIEKDIRGVFDNRDHKIKVYELGRLDNIHFKKELSERYPSTNWSYYGKLHAKFGIVDGHFSFVGSDNLDARSRNLNSETTFFIDNAKIAADLTRAFDKLAERSYLFDQSELQEMLKLKAVKTRVEEMKALDHLFTNIPESGFAN